MTPRLNRFWVILCGVLCLIATGPIRAQQPAFLTNGLVAYYPFNGNARDESGNGKNAILIGSNPEFTTGSGGYLITGANSWAQVPYSESINPKASRTIAFALRKRSGPGRVFSCRRESTGRNWDCSVNDNFIYYTSFRDFNSFVSVKTSMLNNVDGIHYALVLDSVNGDIKVYLNGLPVIATIEFSGVETLRDWVGASAEAPLDIGREDGFPNTVLNAQIRGCRIYNRALSEAEVKALYDFESQPPGVNPRLATATVQVVNGFVIGATVTDGGGGYTNAPVVTISGGGGSGATARASISNGVVTAVSILTAGNGYTSVPTLTIAAPPFPPRRAKGASQVINGFVVGATVLDGGFGYTEPPDVLLVGGGGTGATATAVVQNGVVTGILLVHSGSGYTVAPTVRIASPPFAPSVGIEVSRVRVNLRVVQGRKYQLESSADLQAWVPAGAPFVAQDEDLQQEFDSGSAGTYFRVQQVP